MDLTTLFKDVAHDYVQMVVTPQQVKHVVDRALRIAISRRAVTCMIIPNDVQGLAFKRPAREHGTAHSSLGYSWPRIAPSAADLERAAEVLNAGERVAILVGAGALGAGAEVMEVAELLSAGVAKALLGKAAVADSLPYVTGGIGLLGTEATDDMMNGCDTLLMVGSGFPYSEFLPKDGQARGVQIDIDPSMLGLRYPMEVHLTGDSATTLRELMPLLKAKSNRAWREKIEKSVSDWWQTLEAREMNDAKPVNPQRVFWELSPRLPDQATLTPGYCEASREISFIAWPELLPGAAWPCTSNDGNPKKRSSVVGVVCHPVLAKDEPERGLANEAARRAAGRAGPDAHGQRPGAGASPSRNDKIEQM